MSQLSFTYREGNRSEYLAQFILSALGTCVPVPRTEDIGADFHCTVAKRNGNILTFGSPYLVQIKSEAERENRIVYGWQPPKGRKKGRWKKEQVDWLFSQENPLLIGVVNKDELSLNLYSTSNIWNVFYKQPNPGQVVLLPNVPNEANSDVHETRPVANQGWPEGTGDGQVSASGTR